MSDGLSESRREERAMNATKKALFALREALDGVHDSIFGLPDWAWEDLRATLAPFNLRVVEDDYPVDR